MSIRFDDVYSLATSSTPVDYTDVTQASFSAKVKVGAVGTAMIFVKMGGNCFKFSIGQDASYFTVNWVTNDSTPHSVWYSNSQLDTIYHIACTFDSTNGIILYVNGRNVDTTTTGLPLRVSGKLTIATVTSGDQVWIEDPFFLSGYVFTQDDVFALRDGDVSPTTIGTGASVRAYWTFDGTSGNTVTAGDTAIDNYFGSHADGTAFSTLTGAGSATYDSTLVYTSPVELNKAEIGTSGESIFLFPLVIATQVAPTNLDIVTIPTITVVGNAGTRSGSLLTLPNGNHWSPSGGDTPIMFFLPPDIVVDSSDTVTLDAVESWALSDDGDFSGLDSFSVTNYAGKTINGAETATKTLKLGVNFPNGDTPGNLFRVFANWRLGMGKWFTANATSSGQIPGTNDGTLLNVISGAARANLYGVGNSNEIDDTGYPGPSGKWCITWDTIDDWYLNTTTGNTYENTDLANSGDGGDHGKVLAYDIYPALPTQYINVVLNAESNSGGPIAAPSSVRVYGPGDFSYTPGEPITITQTDPFAVTTALDDKFDTGIGSARWMDALYDSGGKSSIIEPEHLRTLDEFSWGAGYRESFTVGLNELRALTVGASAYIYSSWFGSPYDIVLGENITTTPAPLTQETYTMGVTGEPVLRSLVLDDNGEKMRIVSVNGTSVTIERGSLGTTPTTHTAGNISCNYRYNIPTINDAGIGFIVMEFESDGPHNLITGMVFDLGTIPDWLDSTGVTRNFSSYQKCVFVTGANTFWFVVNYKGGSSIFYPASTTTLDPNTNYGTITVPHGGHSYPPEAVAKATAHFDNADLYFNFPQGGSESLADDCARKIKEHFPSGRKVWLELSNETWNNSFPQYSYFGYISTIRKFTQTNEGSISLSERTGQIYNRFYSIFNADGRGDEIQSVVNCQMGGGGQAANALNMADSGGYTLHAIANAPYIKPKYQHGDTNLAYHCGTVGQILDLLAYEMVYDPAGNLTKLKNQYDLIQTYNTDNSKNCKLICYEGGIERPYPQPLTGNPSIYISADINDSTSTIHVNDSTTPGFCSGMYLQSSDEKFYLTNVNGTILTVDRGALSTTAAAHSSGVSIYDALTKEWAHDLVYDPGFYYVYTTYLKGLQDAGVQAYNEYAYIKPYYEGADWALYHWIYQDYGRGDGSDGKANNTYTLARPDQVYTKSDTTNQDIRNVSVKGYTFKTWNDFSTPSESGSTPSSSGAYGPTARYLSPTFNLRGDSNILNYWDWTTTIAVNSDGSGGTPSNGGSVGYWEDGMGVVNATTTSTYGTLRSPLYISSDFGGKPAIRLDSTNGLSLGRPTDLVNLIASSQSHFTVIVAHNPRWTDNSNYVGYLISKANSGKYGNRLQLVVRQKSNMFLSGRSHANDGLQRIYPDRLNVTAMTVDLQNRSCVKTYVNGYGGLGLNSLGTNLTEDIIFGGQAYNNASADYISQGFVGDIYGIWIYDRLLTPFEHKAVSDIIHEELEQDIPNADFAVIMDVNSILSFNETSKMMPGMLSNINSVYNIGWGGKTAAQQLKYCQEDIAPLADYIRSRGVNKIIFFNHEGSNDLTTNKNVLQSIQNQYNLCREVKPWVDYIVVGNLLDRYTIPREKAVKYNMYLDDFAKQGLADSICDFSDTLLGHQDDSLSAWYYGDKVHPIEPFGMDIARKRIAQHLSQYIPAPSSEATNWDIVFAEDGWVVGRTTGEFTLYPESGHAAGKTAIIKSSYTTDDILSDDASFVGYGSSGTLTWDTTGPSSWLSKQFYTKAKTTIGNRTITVSVDDVDTCTAYSFNSTKTNYYKLDVTDSNTAYVRPGGIKSGYFGITLQNSVGADSAVPVGASGNIYITPETGTITIEKWSTFFDTDSCEVLFTLTPPTGYPSPIAIDITNDFSTTILNPSTIYYSYGNPTQSSYITLQESYPDNGPYKDVTSVSSYIFTYSIFGLCDGSVTGVVSDSLGRSIYPTGLVLTSLDSVKGFRLNPGTPTGYHSLSISNTDWFPNPTNQIYIDRDIPYAADLSCISLSPSSVSVQTGNNIGGTSPYTYEFYYAPDNTGVPGTWVNFGNNDTTTSGTLYPAVPGSLYWFKCITKDTNNKQSSSANYSIRMTDLYPGQPTISDVTHSGFLLISSNASGGIFYGDIVYQPQIASDVNGIPGTFTDLNYPAQSSEMTNISSGYYWVRFREHDMNPVSNAFTYSDPEFVTIEAVPSSSSSPGGVTYRIIRVQLPSYYNIWRGI